MKKPEELVRDLRTIARYLRCSQCFVECPPKEECVFTASAKLIEELETLQLENAAKQQAIEAAAKLLELRTRERDAAVKDVAYSADCWTCGHFELQGDNCQKCRNSTSHQYWKWRGVQEVAENG